MSRRQALVLGLVFGLVGCETPADPTAAADPVGQATDVEPSIDPALLRELLGEAVDVDGDQLRVDGLLVRLAFEPLIRQTGPVTLQLAQGQGYRLSGIAEQAPLWLLGFRDGDVLTHVDGAEILGREHELRGVFEGRPARVEITSQRGTETRRSRLRIASSPSWATAGAAAAEIDPRFTERPVLPTSTREQDASSLAAHVRCVASEATPTKLAPCELERATLDALIADPSPLLSQARLVPSTRDGEIVGFKLYGIRPTTIPALLGLKNGDTIAEINGHPFADLADVLATTPALRPKTITLAIDRRTERLELVIEIVDALD